MSVEFVDTNILVYAHDGGAGAKQSDPWNFFGDLPGTVAGR
jgi:hypothetical protein